MKRWVETADPLHFGNFAGLWSKIPYLLFGTAMSLLAATGMWLRWKRIRRMFQRGSVKAEQARRARMGGWKWATASILVGSVGFGGAQVARFNTPGTQWNALAKQAVEAAGRRLDSRIFHRDGTLYAALPSRTHFDPDRHRISIPTCNLAPSNVTSHVHHRFVRLDHDRAGIADCIRRMSNTATAAGLPAADQRSESVTAPRT